MKLSIWPGSLLILLLHISYPVCAGDAGRIMNISSASLDTVINDYREFYSLKRLERMAVTYGVGAAVANTHTDQLIQNWYQNDIRSSGTNDFSDISKQFGEYKYLLPISLATALVDTFIENTTYNNSIGKWGKRTMRAYLLGTPVLLTSQALTGASRPEENDGSGWQPFNDVNGVSGHAFVGAVPFLVMAGMYDDNKIVKTLFYAASTMTAISRINDDAHYFSQAALGWYLAWEATNTVLVRENRKSMMAVNPLPVPDGYGVSVSMEW